jgi:CRP/FNR family transcriptional regulator
MWPASTVFHEGTPRQRFPLLLSGEIRVARGSGQGRAIELYRVCAGENLVISTSGVIGHPPLVAHGVAVSDCERLVLSPAGFEQWLPVEPFRRFVLGRERIASCSTLRSCVPWPRAIGDPGHRPVATTSAQ